MTDSFELEPQPKSGWRRFVERFRQRRVAVDDAAARPGSGLRSGPVIRWGALAFLTLLALYYPVGALVKHRINDDPAFAPAPIPPEASQTVALAVALIDREVNGTSWPANDPWFFPGTILDNMPNFQSGEIQALQRVVTELRDQIGRSRGTSAADPALQDAASSLNNQPDIWYFDLKRSWAPVTPSETYYRAAMRSLIDFNGRLTRGDAVFERRSDNLLTTLDRIAKDLGGASNDIDKEIDLESGAWFDFTADDIFYRNKGQLYGYALLLQALGQDFRSILNEKGATTVWKRMVDSMIEGAVLQPLVVINGAPGSLAQPNHLAEQGFYLLRGRAQLEEIIDILQK